MDDFNVSSLHESKNEWGARLLTILTPVIIEGFHSIFNESHKLCKDNNEHSKYLMTFQNFITRIPKWNASIIEGERLRIVEKSGCQYLEELITCVHIIQLKLLTAMRAGQKQKKIDINVPKVGDFIHKTYIHAARKVYKNVYLFELNIPPLQTQKNNREIEILIQESILTAVRESIPIESILRAYMDESVEEDVIEEVKEQVTHEKTVAPTLIAPVSPIAQIISPLPLTNLVDNNSIQKSGSLSFNNNDSARDTNNNDFVIQAPKDLDTLQKLSVARAIAESSSFSNDGDSDKIKISMEPAELTGIDVHVLNPPTIELNAQNLLNDIEILM
jgi:hypothetical protein